ncbi:MAG TPA: 50S ribosomal protein L17 [Candidatus Saccharimonadales bacterium]|nr:50S ribosomal protein L17 [Candidatus Saccharimonadales bacterium]
MKKQVFGRHFKRDANERKALFKNLLTSLVIEERITTTEAKAKAIRGAADKLVTKAKKGGPDAFRSLAPDVRYDAVAKLINTIAPRFVNRQGGYTRIIKVGHRVADNAPQVVMEWVDRPEAVVTPAKGKDQKKEDKKEAKGKDEKQSAAAIAKPVVEKKKAVRSSLKQMVTRQKKG